MTDLTPSDGDNRAPVSQLVPVQDRAFAGESRPTINARELHAFLDVKSEFRNWIKNRIEQYGFSEDVDFIAGNFLPGSDQKDYFLTLDMAKQLAMVERNDKGREARLYFIECERRALAAAPQLPDFTDPVAAARAWADEVEAKRRAEAHARALTQQLETDAPYTEIARAITGQATMTRRDWCALMKTDHGLGLRETELTAWLFEKGYLYRDQLSREVRAYAQHATLFKLEVHVINGFARKVLMMTGDGVLQLTPLVVNAFRAALPLDPPRHHLTGFQAGGAA